MSTGVRWRPEQWRLYLVTDQALCLGRPLLDMVAAAVGSVVSCVQLREKQLDGHAFAARALALNAPLGPPGVPLIVNDRIDVALAYGADGMRLGQRNIPPEMARRLLWPAARIGWSVETADDLKRAATLPVDYLGASPVFATPIKPDTKAPGAWTACGVRVSRPRCRRWQSAVSTPATRPRSRRPAPTALRW
jgi:thiamine-phosphate pyrophosphorylase